MSELQPGDIIFYLQDKELVDRAIAWMEKFFKETGGLVGAQFVHVAIVSEKNTLLEMVAPYPAERSYNDNRARVVLRPNVSDEAKLKAVAWCRAHMKERYELPAFLLCHLRLGRSDRFCSQWVRTAYDAGGSPIVDPAMDMVDPDELYEATKAISDVVNESPA